MSVSHFRYIYYFPMLITVRVGVFFKMLYPKPKELHALVSLEWAAGTCYPCNISGKKYGVGRQGLPQNAPQASSASLSLSEKETTTRKEQSRHSPAHEAGLASSFLAGSLLPSHPETLPAFLFPSPEIPIPDASIMSTLAPNSLASL